MGGLNLLDDLVLFTDRRLEEPVVGVSRLTYDVVVGGVTSTKGLRGILLVKRSRTPACAPIKRGWLDSSSGNHKFILRLDFTL